MRASSALPVKQWRTPPTPPFPTASVRISAVSSSASRVWMISGRPVVARRLDMRGEALALGGAVGLVVIIIEPALADGDDARVRRRLDQRRGAEVGMGIGLVRVDADAGPHVGLALGHRDDLVPFALAGRDVEEAADAARAGVGEHLVLALGEARRN